jgi:hypothetical protein
MLEEIIRPHRAPAHVLAVKNLFRFFDLKPARRQINVQDFAVVSIRHDDLLCV